MSVVLAEVQLLGEGISSKVLEVVGRIPGVLPVYLDSGSNIVTLAHESGKYRVPTSVISVALFNFLKNIRLSRENVQKLEILSQFKNRYPEWVSPELLSIKYCQNGQIAFLEMTFSKSPDVPVTTNLDFIADDFDQNTVEEIPLLFRPESDVVDNAKVFIEFDPYSLIMCTDGLFTTEAEETINSNYLKRSQKLSTDEF